MLYLGDFTARDLICTDITEQLVLSLFASLTGAFPPPWPHLIDRPGPLKYLSLKGLTHVVFIHFGYNCFELTFSFF